MNSTVRYCQLSERRQLATDDSELYSKVMDTTMLRTNQQAGKKYRSNLGHIARNRW